MTVIDRDISFFSPSRYKSLTTTHLSTIGGVSPAKLWSMARKYRALVHIASWSLAPSPPCGRMSKSVMIGTRLWYILYLAHRLRCVHAELCKQRSHEKLEHAIECPQNGWSRLSFLFVGLMYPLGSMELMLLCASRNLPFTSAAVSSMMSTSARATPTPESAALESSCHANTPRVLTQIHRTLAWGERDRHTTVGRAVLLISARNLLLPAVSRKAIATAAC